MGARGRQSSASREVAALKSVSTVDRPDAPYSLTDEQSQVWREIVDDLPADWFRRANFELLEQYCRHVVAARHVGQLVANLEKGEDGLDLDEYDKLLKLQEREGRALSSLATRMRITQQALYDKSKKRPAQTKKPWQA